MYGNIFSRSWDEFKILATKHTWYYNLWELYHILNVELEFDGKHHIKPFWQGDRSIIDVSTEKWYRGKPLKSINVVWKYLNLIHLSDLVHCVGNHCLIRWLKHTVRWLHTSCSPKQKNKTTRNDKSPWMQFLGTVIDGHKTFLQPLGDYITLSCAKLHCQYDNGSKTSFVPTMTTLNMMSIRHKQVTE